MNKSNILCHRGLWQKKDDQNSLVSFKKAFESGFGIETDVRDFGSNIVIAHDSPNHESSLFSDVLGQLISYKLKWKPFAINIKADGLAGEIKKIIDEYKLINYFTFDMSIPEMVCYKNAGLKYFSRLSEFETPPVLLDDAAGIWLDAFGSEWYDEDYINNLKKNVKQVCVVSAELHSRDHTNQWALIKGLNNQNKLMLCTDKPNEAKKYFR